MKKSLLFLLLTLLGSTALHAYDACIDGIYYNFSGNKAIVTYKSYLYNSYYSDYSGSVVIPSSVTYNGGTYSVTSIGNYAFYGCSSLTSVTIPNSVTSIGQLAFSGCNSLPSINIPNNVTNIGTSAFSNCTSLTSITIPDSVIGIGYCAFDGCTGLTSVTIGNSVTGIGDYAFRLCSSLTSVTIPNSVTDIGHSVFQSCSSLTSVTIGTSLTSIGNYTFEYCSSLTSVTIPNGVTSIGGYAFHNCTSLTSITIPNSVTSIGNNAFWNCTKLTSMTIPNSVTDIGYTAFSGCFFSRNNFINNSILTNSSYWGAILCDEETGDGLLIKDNVVVKYRGTSTTVTIPEYVVSIGEQAFQSCYNLTSVTIPYSVTDIGVRSFSECKNLATVTIGSGVSSIGGGAFNNCSGLKSVTLNSNAIVSATRNSSSSLSTIFGNQVTQYVIGNSVYAIGDYAFYGCSSLTSITIPSSLKRVKKGAFKDCTSLSKVIVTDIAAWCGIIYEGNDSNGDFPLGVARHLYSDENTEITEIVIPESVTSIGDYAFSGCSSLTSVTIPNSVTSIGDCAFDNCMNLKSVTMPASNLSFEGWWAFGGDNNIQSVYISDLMKWLCVDFGSNNPLRSGAKLYLNNVEVNDLVIPDGTTSIHTAAFEGCGSITTVTIPSSVTSIGDWAFSGCSSLTSVTIPSSVTSIGETAFKSCTGLTDVYCYAENVPSTESNAFDDSKVEYSRLHVPAGSVASYKATAPWSGFGAIVGIGEDADTETIEIATAEDLKNFADRVNDGETLLCAKLTADIDFTAYPTSVIRVGYYGEFDGAGHSIRLDMNRTSDCALFGFLCGYVHDLTTTGAITTSVQFAGGIAAQTGKATIERCQSRVDINSSVDGDGTHGGIVGVSHVGTIIRDCLVSGSITGSNTTCCGGVSGWADGKTTITNCLIKSTFTVSTTNSDLLSRNPSNVISTNNYFQGEWNAPNNCSNVTLLTESQVESGEACYRLNAGRTGEEMAWYQTLGEDDFPVPDNSHLSVCYSNGLYRNEITDITITIGSSVYATYCSSYPLDFSEVSGMKAYIASGFSPSTGKLVLTRVTEVPAGEGLYLVGEAGTYEVAIAKTDMFYSNLLKGVTSATTLYPTDGSYTNFILANGAHGVAFYSLSEAGQLAAGKAYLQLPTASVSEVKAISVIFDDDNEDGISRPTPAPSRIGGEVYNLQGQQVSAPKSGLYIINGKKMFIK